MSRSLPVAIAGALGTAGLLFLLQPDSRDPLRLSVALLPLLVAGFATLCGARVGKALSRRRRVVLGAVAAWGVLALGCRQLTLPHAEAVVAAAGVLVLTGWLAVELPGLLRRLRRTGTALPPPVFFLLPALVYASVLPWIHAHHTPGGDEPYYLLVTHSLAYDGDLDLANNYRQRQNDALRFVAEPIEPQPGDPEGDQGQIYSRHAPAVPLLLALPYRLAGRTGAAIVMLLIAAATAWSGLALARELHPRRHRGQLLAWLVLAFGSPLALYSYRFWSEVPAALGLTLACVLILRLRDTRPPTVGRVLLPALLLAYPVLLKPRFALVAAPLAVLAWWRAGAQKRLATIVGAILLIAGTGVLILNLAHFDRILGKYSLDALNLARYAPGDWLRGAAGFLLDGAFGLATAYPIWLLLLPALVLTARSGESAGRYLLLAWVPYFLLLLPRTNAFTQFAPPFRYALACLPLLAACLAPVLEDRRASVRAITRALAVLSLVLAIVWVVQPDWTVNRVTGTSHLIDRLELLTRSDFGRLFPSYMRVRAAAWVWVGVVLLFAACWRWWPSRPRLRGLVAPSLLLFAAAIAWSAGHAPTRTVEFEDPWIEHRGGQEFPPPWEPWAQPRAWRLEPGESVRIPLIPGGPVLRPTLRLGHLGDPGQRVAIELADDSGRVLRSWEVEPAPDEPWQWHTLPPLQFPPGRPIGLTVRALTPVTLDQARFEWRGHHSWR